METTWRIFEGKAHCPFFRRPIATINLSVCLATALALLNIGTTIRAAVPQLMSYQGRVQVNGTNFTGTGHFKFALIEITVRGFPAVPATNSLWSNDRTSVDGDAPTNAVPLHVVNGLVMCLLGDTSLPNMEPLLSDVFDRGGVRLRVWFSATGAVKSFQQLSPDHRIASVGYAMMSQNVPDGAITAEKLADNSVTADKLAVNSVDSSSIATDSVGSSELRDSISLGSAASPFSGEHGRLDIYRVADGPAISLSGSNNTIEIFGPPSAALGRQRHVLIEGDDGGTIRLFHDTTGASGAQLQALGTTSLLFLNNDAGAARATLTGGSSGGALTVYQTDGQFGVFVDGNDASGAGVVDVRKANGVAGAKLLGGSTSGSLELMKADNGVGLRALGGGASGSIEAYQDNGNLGIHIIGDNGSGGAIGMRNNGNVTTAYIDASINGGGYFSARNGSGSEHAGMVAVGPNNGGRIWVNDENGTVAIELLGAEAAGNGGQVTVFDENGAAKVILDAHEGSAAGAIRLMGTDGVAKVILQADNGGEGRVTTEVLTITGGSDLSEQFDINAINEQLKPGMLVSIDPKNAGELILSTKAFDRTAAGVISGAGGVKTGMLMGQHGTKADGKHPVALTGRVYCWVDADAAGAVEPGDLITTSDTPGHGMKVIDHAKAAGAIIGKAMTSLDKGKGLVLVLVSLQ